MRPIVAGSTNINQLFLLTKKDDGTPATGLTPSAMTLAYIRDGGTVVSSALSALAAVDSAHTDYGAFEVNATTHPGLYRVCIPDAAVTAGVTFLVVTVTHADIWPASKELSLTGKWIDNLADFAGGEVASVAGNVGGNVAGSVASVAGNVGGSVASVTNGVTLATNAVNAAALATDAVNEIAAAIPAAPTAGAVADAVWDEDKTGHTGDLKSVADKLADATGTLANSATADDYKADVSGIATDVTAIKERTDNLPNDPASQAAIAALEMAADVIKVNGVAVSGVADFQADVSGISTFNHETDQVSVIALAASIITAIRDGLSTFGSATDPVQVGSIADGAIGPTTFGEDAITADAIDQFAVQKIQQGIATAAGVEAATAQIRGATATETLDTLAADIASIPGVGGTVDANIVSVTETPVTDVTDFHGEGGIGGGIVLAPLIGQSVTSIPVRTHIEIVQHASGPALRWFIIDADGVPVDMTGKVVEIAVWNKANELLISALSSDASPAIEIEGDDNDQIVFSYTPADTAEPLDGKYMLWDSSNPYVPLATGRFVISVATRSGV